MRFAINGVISGVILIIFERIGWVEFPALPTVFVDPTLNVLLVAFIIGFLIGVIMTIAGKIFGLFVILTCLTGIILLPIYMAAVGYLSLWVVTLIFPQWITIANLVWWQKLILSLTLGFIRYHEKPKKKGGQEQESG